MRKLLAGVFLSTFLLSASTARQTSAQARGPVEAAWWVTIEFKPIDTSIRGIPVDAIDPTWRLASELKKDFIPRELLYEPGFDLMEEYDHHFSIAGDFNKDGRTDVALVGVHETIDGERGMFFLILTQNYSGSWEKAFLAQGVRSSGFSALTWRKGCIEVWGCMECDGVSFLRWSPKLKEYIWVPQHSTNHFSAADIEQFENELKNDYILDSDARLILAWAYTTYPEYRHNEQLRQRALDYADKAKTSELIGNFREAVGAALYANGKLAEGDAWFDKLTKSDDAYAPYYRETKENLRELYFPNPK